MFESPILITWQFYFIFTVPHQESDNTQTYVVIDELKEIFTATAHLDVLALAVPAHKPHRSLATRLYFANLPVVPVYVVPTASANE